MLSYRDRSRSTPRTSPARLRARGHDRRRGRERRRRQCPGLNSIHSHTRVRDCRRRTECSEMRVAAKNSDLRMFKLPRGLVGITRSRSRRQGWTPAGWLVGCVPIAFRSTLSCPTCSPRLRDGPRACWSRRRARARRPGCAGLARRALVRRRRSCCSSRAASPRAPPPNSWRASAASRPGATFGYATRLDSKVGKATRVIAMTHGVFFARIQADPELAGVSRRAVRRSP